jgi:poly(A) polymerase
LLRAVRFAARLGFRIDPATLDAIRDHHREIGEVSQERIRDELTKMLTENHARRAFELLESTGLLQETLPEMAATRGVEQPPQFHPEGDVWTHTLMMIDGLHDATPTLAWGVLLHDVGKPPTFQAPQHAGDRIRFNNHAAVGARMAEAICERLKFSRHDTERVVELVEHHLRFKDVQQMRESKLKRFLRLEGFAEHLELHRLDCESSHRDLSAYRFVKEKLAELTEEEVSPPPLVDGNDLIAMGYRPGPAFREMLNAVEDAQLEGQVHTRTEACAWLREHYRHM